MTFSWVLDERKYLTLDQVRILRQYCGQKKQKSLRQEEFHGVRDWFVLQLGLNTGLRVQEMTDLKCGDLLVSALQGSVIVRKGKGKKKRRVRINEPFKKDCQFYLRWKHRYGHSVEDEAPLLTSEQGKPLTKRALQKVFKRTMKEAGLASHYSIHCLRHTYGTHLLKASGNNLRIVQEQLGHSSVRTTEVYTSLIESEVGKALSKLYS